MSLVSKRPVPVVWPWLPPVISFSLVGRLFCNWRALSPPMTCVHVACKCRQVEHLTGHSPSSSYCTLLSQQASADFSFLLMLINLHSMHSPLLMCCFKSVPQLSTQLPLATTTTASSLQLILPICSSNTLF